MNTIKETNFHFEGQQAFYRGKVRDVYTIGEMYLAMVATDRISAFDVVLPRAIPCKGQVLNQIAAKFLKETDDIVPNWVVAVPDPCVTIGYQCQPFKVEMVIRGYLAGHAWREYQAGKRTVCGELLADGLRENDRLPEPIITPTTKAAQGHDEDISKADILAQGIVSAADYMQLEAYTKALYARGTELAVARGLILADTKYEFGKRNGEIYLIDEIHTPDSSRYFYADSFEQLQHEGRPQRQLSKEFVRRWLIENGFQGKEGQRVPEMTDEIVYSISERYTELFEHITGERFVYPERGNLSDRIAENTKAGLQQLVD